MGSLLRRAIGSRFAAVGFQEASPCAMVRIGRWALRRINSQSVGLPCPRFTEGQEFIVEYGRQPKDFCGWAWNDIHKACLVPRQGGNFRLVER